MSDNTPIDTIHSRDNDQSRPAFKESPHESLGIRPESDTSPPVEAQRSTDANNIEVKYQQDVVPDGGYGWVCVACVFWINAHTWGINSVSDIAHYQSGFELIEGKYRAMVYSSPTTSRIMYSPTPQHCLMPLPAV